MYKAKDPTAYFQSEDYVDGQTLLDMRDCDLAINDLTITIPAGTGTNGPRHPATWECVLLRPVIVPEGVTTIRLRFHLELIEPPEEVGEFDVGGVDFRFGAGLTSIVSDAEVRSEGAIFLGDTITNSILEFELDVIPRTLPYLTNVQLWMKGNAHNGGIEYLYDALPELITPQQVRTPDEMQFGSMSIDEFETYNMVIDTDQLGDPYSTPREVTLVYRSQAGSGALDTTGGGSVQVMGVYPMADVLGAASEPRAWRAVPYSGARIGECLIEMEQDIRYLHTIREADIRAGEPLISNVPRLLLGFQETILAGPRPVYCSSQYKGLELNYTTQDSLEALVPHHLLCDTLDVLAVIPRATYGETYYEPEEMVIRVKDLDGTVLETETRDLTPLGRPTMDRDPTAYDFFGTTNSRPWVVEQVDTLYSEGWAVAHTISDLYQHRGVDSEAGPAPLVLEVFIKFPGNVEVPPGLIFVTSANTPAGASDA